MDDVITVEVVYALPHEQALVAVQLPRGATLLDAIRVSNLPARYPAINSLIGETGSVGIFGKAVSLDTVLNPGDRVELYRPLTVDPKEARRRRADLRKRKPKAPPAPA